MAYLLVDGFSQGMDRRRPQVAGVPGTLWTAANCFISRGGDVVRAKKFDAVHTLTAGTFGLAALKSQRYVFGSATAPSMPALVQYQRLQAGGTKATATVTVTGGTASAGVNMVTQVNIAGSLANGQTISANLLTAAVDWVTSHPATATALAVAINLGTSVHGFTAAAVGAVVTITSRDYHGAVPNGWVVTTTEAGDVTTTDVNFASGASATMIRVHDAKAFQGNLYAIAEFNDGSIHHFYDSNRVVDWDDIADLNFNYDRVAEVLARKVSVNAAVHAAAVGSKVIITAEVAGTSFTCVGATTDNGAASTPTATATQITANVAAVAEVRATGTVTITGGTANPGTNKISSATVNAVELLAADVNWTASNNGTANALGIAINNNSAVSGYTATILNAVVTIKAAVGTGATPNGFVVTTTEAGNVTTTDANMAGGVTAVTAVAQVYEVAISATTADSLDLWKITVNAVDYQTTGRGAGTGTNVFVQKKRVWSLVGSVQYGCALQSPTDWTTTSPVSDARVIIDMSGESEDAQDLIGAASYQGQAAFFGEDVILRYQLFADAEEISIVDTVSHTGCHAARSIVPYGNLDVYYLDHSGIRSLRTRDGYDAAYMSDVGNAIDGFVQEWMAITDEDTLSRSVAVVDPAEGRYLLAIGDRIFGLSYFPQSKITAWSYIDPGFTVTDLISTRDGIYARSGDVIYRYGGADSETYPAAGSQSVVVETPFMSARDPAGFKYITGYDMAGENDWLVEMLVDPNDTSKTIELGTVSQITLNQPSLELPGYVAVMAFRFTCSAAGYATLSMFALHYDKDPDAN